MFSRLLEILAAYTAEAPLLLDRRAAWRVRLRWRESFVPHVRTATGKLPTSPLWESLLDTRSQALWLQDAQEAYRTAELPSSRAYIFLDVRHRAKVDETTFLASFVDKLPHGVAKAFVEAGPESVDLYLVEEEFSWTIAWPHERDCVPLFTLAQATDDPPPDDGAAT